MNDDFLHRDIPALDRRVFRLGTEIHNGNIEIWVYSPLFIVHREFLLAVD